MTAPVDIATARRLAQDYLDGKGPEHVGDLARAVLALTSPIPADLETIRTLAAACPWKGPWKAGQFEIECPCPNGESCGCSHTCDEVTAPEEYPEGGQCVVQIAVPGLERFAEPTAAYIAALDPQTVLGLVARVAAAEREVERLRHGDQIEGDYICPDSLALAEARAEVERLTREQNDVGVRLALSLDFQHRAHEAERALAAARAEVARLATEADALAAWGLRTAEHDEFVRREYESASNNEDALYVENERLSSEVDRVTREADALAEWGHRKAALADAERAYRVAREAELDAAYDAATACERGTTADQVECQDACMNAAKAAGDAAVELVAAGGKL